MRKPSPRANVVSARPAGGGSQASAAAPAGPSQEGELAGLSLVLRLEALARAAADLTELRHLIANELRKLTRARQIFVIELGTDDKLAVSAVTGVSTPDARSVLVEGIAALTDAVRRERGLSAALDFTLPAFADPASEVATAYPFREIAWLPFLDRRDAVFAGIVLARDQPWSKDDLALAGRLAATFAHAWRELATSTAFRARRRLPRWRLAIAAALVLALLLPVPLTALAPVEIVAAEPFVVAAPIDGVIDEVLVEPSAPVAAGDVLVRLADTTLRNRVEVARREVAVAEAKLRQATIMAFAEARGRHELGIAQAELEVKRADLALAAEQLERTIIRSTRAGIAVFADRRQLFGKPVATGERIMEIADPSAVEARIDLAVADAIALRPDSFVKLFLDVDPLRPIKGRVVRSDYQARVSDTDVLAFRTFARLETTPGTSSGAVPRIGLRGTAQVWGDPTALAIVLLRRPISAIRQWLGL